MSRTRGSYARAASSARAGDGSSHSFQGPLGLLDPFTPPSEFKIEIRHDSTEIPSGLTRQKYVLLHDKDYDSSTKDYEQIKRACKSNPPPCLDSVQVLADGDFLVTAQVTGNWRFR